MEELTLAADQPQRTAGAPVTPWVADSFHDAPYECSCEGKATGPPSDAQGPEWRDTSDPFAQILEKVGAPAALLKNRKEIGKSPTIEELKEERAKTSSAAGGLPQPHQGPLGMPQEKDVRGPTSIKNVAVSSAAVQYLDNKEYEIAADILTPLADDGFHRNCSSCLPEAKRAVGEPVFLEDDIAFIDACEVSSACQSNSDTAAATLLENGARRSTADSITPRKCTSPRTPSEAPTTLAGDGTERPSADFSARSSSSDALQWPFESGLRPWEDIGKEVRKAAEGISGHQLEDYKKKRIWVVHRGVCTPVSWYLDTSAEDVKTSVLCACDVLADEGEQEEQGQAGSGFCLREIRPLPDSADVDCDDLFMAVRTLRLRCGLQPSDEADVPPLQQGESERLREAAPVVSEKTEDNEVEVRVVLGARVFSKDFPSLTDGATYLLEPHTLGDEDPQQREELQHLRKLTGDKWRRLSVAVDPLLHIETQKAVLQMRRGANLLKHTRFGHPHLRQFQLSADRQRLVWYSASKGKGASMVQMAELQGLVLGQKSATFAGYRIPALQHLSFSLVFKEEESAPDCSAAVELPHFALEDARTLDLTCKDEFEFDAWVTGCKAIIAANKGIKLSKMQLLSHSRRFAKAIKRSDTTVQLTKLPEIKERAGLQDCMDLPWHPPEELERKYEEQKKRVDAVAEELRGLDRKAVVRSNVDLSVLLGAGPAYATILGDSTEIDDEEMEFERMQELLQEVIAVLKKAKLQLTEYREAERARRSAAEEAAASMESRVYTPPNEQELAEIQTEAFPASEETSESATNLSNLDSSSILAISSMGQVLLRTGAPGLTFEEKFKMASAHSVDLEAVQEQIKEGIATLVQHAASQTAEAQQLLSSALSAAAAAVGVETEQQDTPAERLPPEDVEKLKSINQLLWRAEVDVENIEDMLERLQAPSGFSGLALAGTVANLNQMVTEQVNKWSGQLVSMMTDILKGTEIPQLVQSIGPPQAQEEPRFAYTNSEYHDELS